MALRLSGSLTARPDASAAKGAFYFGTAVAEVFTVDFGVLTGTGVAGKYVSCADADGAVYFWFNTGASVDPNPGGRGIVVAVLAGDAASALATKLAAKVDSAFTLSASGTVVTVTNTVGGARTNAAGNSGATVTTTTAGADDEAGVFESDGVTWLDRTIVDRVDIVDRTSGELADRPEASTMVGWYYFATDTEDTYEAFPTGWFLVA